MALTSWLPRRTPKSGHPRLWKGMTPLGISTDVTESGASLPVAKVADMELCEPIVRSVRGAEHHR